MAPDAEFRAVTDSTSEYLGVGCIRTPGPEGRLAPVYGYECGPEGEPVVAVETLLRMRDMTDLHRITTGRDHFQYVADRLNELRATPLPDRTLPVAVCDSCEIRKRCSCEEDAEDEAYAVNAVMDRLPGLA